VFFEVLKLDGLQLVRLLHELLLLFENLQVKQLMFLSLMKVLLLE
jgi:hypothetical protein